ncbi:MAG: HAD family hydrolase [Pseudomonadota bacterium]
MKKKLYILLISVHGLIRGKNLELGRDADTGGQTKYVVELARALAAQPGVSRVDLLTRLVDDPTLSGDYARPKEAIGKNAHIIRLEAGPPEYIRKEEIWDHLDSFADNALNYLRELGQTPDIIHGHYADAGYVGVRLANLLALPLVFTGHSLGRVKRSRLIAGGIERDQIESRYNMARRIEAEESVLAYADLVVASTHNEIEDQYGLYDYYQPEHKRIIPPGTDLERFFPPEKNETAEPIAQQIGRFLRDPEKPMILALSRPDERKNISTLVRVYGESNELQKRANLCIVAGNRDDIREMDSGARWVIMDLLMLIDRYDLYGTVAYPKAHDSEDVPIIYRLATGTGGVFINPALTEPFGLTLIEAAASGLPIVATEDGGPTDIIGNCRNGLLVNPLDKKAIAKALLKVLKEKTTWRKFSLNGLKGVKKHYSWDGHAQRYLSEIAPLAMRTEPPQRISFTRNPKVYRDRAIFTDLDQNLLSDRESLRDFVRHVKQNRKRASFGIATGRRLESALQVLKEYDIPRPDILITSVGTEIYYAPALTADVIWSQHIAHQWNPKTIRRLLDPLPGLKLQPEEMQSRFKISYFIDPQKAPTLDDINRMLHQEEETVQTILSFGQFLDILPVRASKGLALRYVAHQWDIPLEHILAAGGSGADEDMMRGNTLAVIVANRHHEELSQLTDIERIYFAKQPFSRGILEAIEYYDFYGACRVPAT